MMKTNAFLVTLTVATTTVVMSDGRIQDNDDGVPCFLSLATVARDAAYLKKSTTSTTTPIMSTTTHLGAREHHLSHDSSDGGGNGNDVDDCQSMATTYRIWKEILLILSSISVEWMAISTISC